MPAARSHDRTYVEPERHDELSDGAPAAEQADAGHERTPKGQLSKGASTTPRKGGKAHKGSTRLTHRIDSLQVTDQLKRRARFMRRKTCSELAATVGAGHCGIIASLLVKLASEDIALREAALDGDNVEAARKLGESARMHLLYAREIAAKDGEARAKARGPRDPLAAFRLPGDGGEE
jgi:hypothetical protein